MNITLNGESVSVDDNLSLSQLVELLGYTGRKLAIEVNLEIIPKSEHADYALKEDDKVEVVQAIGGG